MCVCVGGGGGEGIRVAKGRTWEREGRGKLWRERRANRGENRKHKGGEGERERIWERGGRGKLWRERCAIRRENRRHKGGKGMTTLESGSHGGRRRELVAKGKEGNGESCGGRGTITVRGENRRRKGGEGESMWEQGGRGHGGVQREPWD